MFNWKTAFSKTVIAGQSVPDELKLLRETVLFSNMSESAQGFLIDRFVIRRYSTGEMIFRDDNPGVCLFIVQQGEVELFVERDEAAIVQLGLLKVGALFGEIATTCGYKRTASARARRNDTLLLSVSSFDLDDLNKRFPRDGLTLQQGVTRSVVDSLISTTEQLRDAERKILVLQQRLQRSEK